MENNENLNFISLKEASEISGYHQEYLGYLARSKKLKAVKIGRNWLTTQNWLSNFLKENNHFRENEEKQKIEFTAHQDFSPIFKTLKKQKAAIILAVIFLFFIIFEKGLIFNKVEVELRPELIQTTKSSLQVISDTGFEFKSKAERVAQSSTNKISSLSSHIVSQTQKTLGQVQGITTETIKEIRDSWIPAFAGMTESIEGMTERAKGITETTLQQVQGTLRRAQGIVKDVQGIISKPFASIYGWFAKDRPSPLTEPVIVREIIQQETPKEILKQVQDDIVSPPQTQTLIQKQPIIETTKKQIIEITKETRVVETVVETIREITRAADLIPIENMLNSLSSRLSSVIDTSGYVSSPRQYQQDGDLFLTTTGSGNVYVSASQGTYISGQQLILDATASGNQGQAIIQLRDATFIQGTLSAQNGIDITNANLTVGGSKFIVSQDTGNITSAGLLSLTQTTGTSTVSHNLRVSGQLTVGTGTTYITADYIQTPYFTSGSTSTAVTGDFSVSSNATTTGNQIIQGTLTVNSTSTLATTSLAYLTATSNATSTFAGGLTIDSDTLVIDYQTNRVGIGTSSPYAKLSVVGQTVSDYFTATSTTATSTFPYLSITNNSSLGTIIGGTWQGSTIALNYGGTGLTSATAGYTLIGNSSTALQATSTLFVSTGGNVGIGTTSPSYKLTIQGGTGENLLQIATSTAPNIFVITSSGNVGIGSTSPSQLLSIAGNGYFTGGLGVGIATTTAGAIQTSGGIIGGSYLYLTGSATLNSTLNVSATSTLATTTIQGILSVSGTGTSTFTGPLSHSTGNLIIARGGTGDLLFNPYGGNVGIATTSPSQLFSVAGQCVTGDTRLRRRRKKKGVIARSGSDEAISKNTTGLPRSPDGSLAMTESSAALRDDEADDYIYDEVQIKNIQPGDEVASLDEKTGKIVWSKVNKLMYMGKKQTYRLITALGRQIRTTDNHPYLTQNGWKKVKEIKVGQPIAVPKARFKKTYVFIDASNIIYSVGAGDSGWKMDFAKLMLYLKTRFAADEIFYYAGLDNENRKQLKFYEKLQSFGYNLRLVPVKTFSNGKKKGDIDSRMTFEIMKYFNDYDNALIFTGDGDFYWVLEYLLESKNIKLFGVSETTALDLKSLLKGNFTDLGNLKNLLSYTEGNKKIGQTLLKDLPRRIMSVSYQGKNNLSSPDVENSEPDILWDKIISIEPVAEEDVYDIEVEGTHNFIGNDIVAHNTYITGGLGIGQTETTAGNITGTGRLSITGASATSTLAGGLTVDTDTLVVDYSTGRVGIGTTSPRAMLEIGPASGDLQQNLNLPTGSSWKQIIMQGSNDQYAGGLLVASTRADAGAYIVNFGQVSVGTFTSRFVVENTGNVGIGTTSPGEKLDVNGNINLPVGNIVMFGDNGNHGFTRSDSGTDVFIQAVGGYGAGAGSAFRVWDTTAGAARVTVKFSDGNVGIGTTTPQNALHIQNAATQFRISPGDGGQGMSIDVDNNDTATFGTTNGGAFSIRPMTTYIGGGAYNISSIRVGGAANAAIPPLFSVVSGGLASSTVFINNTGGSAGTGNYILQVQWNNANALVVESGSGNLGLDCSNPNSDLEIGGTGTNCDTGTGSYINAGSTQFTANSSQQWKENIVDFTHPDILSAIKNVKIRHYDWKDEFCAGEDCKDKIGFIAEEFFTIFRRGKTTQVRGDEVQAALWLGLQELNAKVDGLAASILSWLEDKVVKAKEFVAEKITTKKLCVEDVCVDRTQLKELLDKNQIQY